MVVFSNGAIIALNRCVAVPELVPTDALGDDSRVPPPSRRWPAALEASAPAEHVDMASAEDQSSIIVPPQLLLIKPIG